MALMVVLAALGVGMALYLLSFGMPRDGSAWLLVIMCLLVAVAPIAMWSSAGTYLVPGGRGELRVFTDRVELWTAGEGTKLFPLADLQLQVTQHVARVRFAVIPMGEVNTDKHLMLQCGEQRVILSQKLFERADAIDRIARMIDPSYRADDEDDDGPPSESAPRDEYDDRLDRELDALD
jgi:hypothetical protein